MIDEYIKQLLNGEEIRKNLIGLKAEIKETEAQKEWAAYFKREEIRTLFLQDLLAAGDAKIRKNAALLIGEAGDNSCLAPLYDAYEAEGQLFNKSSYLTAMAGLNYIPVLEKLKERAEELKSQNPSEESRKHIEEEKRKLGAMLLSVEQPKPHRMKQGATPFTAVLITNRNHIHITARAFQELPQKQIPAGLMVRTDRPERLFRVRTFRELYFAVDGMKSCGSDPEEAAEAVAGGNGRLLRFLEACHEGSAPFYFRLEVKNRMEPAAKAACVKKLAALIETKSGNALVNTPSFYELEIRLIETREGGYNILIRLFTLHDNRFAYRKNVVASSIHPVNAALTAALAEDYLREGAQILDPFCGVGTMLIERARLVKPGTMYGIDSFGDAIRGARENTKAAGELVNYINRDFFDFTHEYLFDEVITDMPWTKQASQRRTVEELYRRFFERVPRLVKPGGVVILYTHDRKLVKRYAGAYLKLEKEYEISMKEETHVMILTVR